MGRAMTDDVAVKDWRNQKEASDSGVGEFVKMSKRVTWITTIFFFFSSSVPVDFGGEKFIIQQFVCLFTLINSIMIPFLK